MVCFRYRTPLFPNWISATDLDKGDENNEAFDKP